MSSVVRSYTWIGVNRGELNQQVSPDMLYILSSPVPTSACDATIDTSGLSPETIADYCAQMDSGMLLQSWQFVSSIEVP
jgi:hypothetical protein